VRLAVDATKNVATEWSGIAMQRHRDGAFLLGSPGTAEGHNGALSEA